MNEKYLIANGLRLAYNDFGDEQDPAIILIMGIATQMIAWPNEMCETLANHGFYVIRFDNRDVGLSQKIELHKPVSLPKILFKYQLKLPFSSPYRLTDMANDALGLLKALKIQKAHWVGASMGGMIAQVLAAQAPEQTLSLTSIMSTSGNRSLPKADLKTLKQLLFRPNAKNESDYVKHNLKTWKMIGSPDYPPKESDLAKKILTSLHRNYYPAGFHNHMAAILESGDRRGLLRKIATRSLIIHGKKDKLIPVECGIDTANNIKNATLELIPGMGHDIPKELIPKLVNSIAKHAKASC